VERDAIGGRRGDRAHVRRRRRHGSRGFERDAVAATTLLPSPRRRGLDVGAAVAIRPSPIRRATIG
jgi:hypothetical protein